MPKNTRRDLAAATYAKAVLWESLRLSPVAVGAGRILDQSANLGGFLVPKGTVVVAMNQVPKIQNKTKNRFRSPFSAFSSSLCHNNLLLVRNSHFLPFSLS